MNALLLALQFLTAIPVRLEEEVTPRLTARAMTWFPVVGLMLGAILVLVDLEARLLFPPLVASVLVLVAWVALTGALHLDGFLDCCDGLLGAKSPEKRLDILRDSRVGAFAAVGAICLLLLKFAALAELPADRRAPVLFIVPALTRAVMVYAARAYPYARPGPGLGQLFRDELTWGHVALAALVAVVVSLLALGWMGVVLGVWVWLVTVAIAWWVQRRIPGLTGDVYGAINEVTEVAALLLVLVVGRLL